MSGYVRLHRALLGHAAFRNDAEAMAFAWLVARAAWQPCRVRYKARPVSLERGQLAISVRDFADAMDRDKAWVERLFKRLRNEGMAETRAETGVTVVTICNYDKYQCEGAERETPRKTRARQTRDTEQGREEGKKEETPSKAPKGPSEKTLLPEDWVVPSIDDLPPQAQACARQWTAGSYAARAEEFVSFWRTRRRKMADWRLTWAGRVVALHSTVMRDQKFGNAPSAANDARPSKPMTAAERETMARYHEGRGEIDKAEKLRREATGPPGQPIGRVADRIAAGVGTGG
jgi:hypothetical protein